MSDVFEHLNLNSVILIYTDNNGLTRIDVKLEEDTLWLTQAQMCELYQTSKSNVSEHIKHIFEEGELQEDSVVRKFRTTAPDGKSYTTAFYNLDKILTMSGEQLLQDAGKVPHSDAMEHATNEYRKYKQLTISEVEPDYLNSIKRIDNIGKKGKSHEN